MAKYKLVFEDIKRNGQDGFSVHMEDEDGNNIERLELEHDEVTIALMEALSIWEQYKLVAPEVEDENGNIVGGTDFDSGSTTKH